MEEKSPDGRGSDPRGARGNAAVTREVIVNTAGSLFASQGYDGTTVAEVAREAGVAVGTVYRHFDDKTDLLYAVKEGWDEHLSGVFSRPEVVSVPHRLRIRGVMEAIFDEGSRHAEMLRLMGLPNHLVGSTRSETAKAHVQGAIKSFLDDAVEAGIFREIDTETAAVISYGMVEAALTHCLEADGWTSKERYVEALVDALEHWVVAAL